ncbi:MAG: CDP-archaeol synthase [Victivallaceae bacterium]|nr:CDP-archaeol synthase [Victivallaceae bacterium]
MFIYRAISFPLLLVMLGAMLYWRNSFGGYVFAALAVLGIGMLVYEICAMLRNIEIKTFPKTFGMIAGLMMLFFFIPYLTLLFSIVLMVFWGAFIVLLGKKSKMVGWLAGIGVSAVVILSFMPFIDIFFGSGDNRAFLFFVLTTKAMDTGGYIFGKLTSYLPGGNHKMVPTISPHKSWEGTIGGVLFSVAVGLIFFFFFPFLQLPYSLAVYVLVSIVMAIGSLAGDLTESAIKRTCDVKDSNSIIPGMGGVFDVLDSFIYNGVVFSLLTLLWR